MRPLRHITDRFLAEPRQVVASLRLLVFAGLAVLGWSDPPVHKTLFWIVTVIYGLSVIGYVVARNGEFRMRRVRCVIFLFDAAVVSALIVLRGRDVQAIIMAYFTLVLMAGLMAGIGSGLMNGLAVSVLYTVVIGWGRPPAELLEFEHLGQVVFFFVIAVFMGQMAGTSRSRGFSAGAAPRDVDGLRASTALLRQAREGTLAEERLQTAGLLCAGIAHEMRGPLAALREGTSDSTAILDQLDGAEDEGGDSKEATRELRELLEDCAHAASRLQAVATDLNEIASGGSAETRVLPPAEILEGTERMLSRGHASGVELSFEDRSERSLRIDPARMRQVLIVLAGNAIDALDDAGGGRVRVSSEDRGPDRVAFLVEDDGPGMPQEVVDRIYDPFYTTKGPQRGVGLGLYVAREIVRTQGGTIDCCSTAGRGTTFCIEMPATDATADTDADADADAA